MDIYRKFAEERGVELLHLMYDGPFSVVYECNAIPKTILKIGKPKGESTPVFSIGTRHVFNDYEIGMALPEHPSLVRPLQCVGINPIEAESMSEADLEGIFYGIIKPYVSGDSLPIHDHIRDPELAISLKDLLTSLHDLGFSQFDLDRREGGVYSNFFIEGNRILLYDFGGTSNKNDNKVGFDAGVKEDERALKEILSM